MSRGGERKYRVSLAIGAPESEIADFDSVVAESGLLKSEFIRNAINSYAGRIIFHSTEQNVRREDRVIDYLKSHQGFVEVKDLTKRFNILPAGLARIINMYSEDIVTKRDTSRAAIAYKWVGK